MLTRRRVIPSPGTVSFSSVAALVGGGIHDSVPNCGIMGPVTNEGLGGPGDVLFRRVKVCRAELGFVENYNSMKAGFPKLKASGYDTPVKLGLLLAHTTKEVVDHSYPCALHSLLKPIAPPHVRLTHTPSFGRYIHTTLCCTKVRLHDEHAVVVLDDYWAEAVLHLVLSARDLWELRVGSLSVRVTLRVRVRFIFWFRIRGSARCLCPGVRLRVWGSVTVKGDSGKS